MSISKYFKPEFNIGHVLTALMLAGTLLGVWRASEIRAINLERDSRQQAIEIQQLRENQSKMSDSLDRTARALERVNAQLELMLKRQPMRYEP